MGAEDCPAWGVEHWKGSIGNDLLRKGLPAYVVEHFFEDAQKIGEVLSLKLKKARKLLSAEREKCIGYDDYAQLNRRIIIEALRNSPFETVEGRDKDSRRVNKILKRMPERLSSGIIVASSVDEEFSRDGVPRVHLGILFQEAPDLRTAVGARSWDCTYPISKSEGSSDFETFLHRNIEDWRYSDAILVFPEAGMILNVDIGLVPEFEYLPPFIDFTTKRED